MSRADLNVTPQEILAWIHRHPGATASSAVDHFSPGLTGAERIQARDRIKKLIRLEKQRQLLKPQQQQPQLRVVDPGEVATLPPSEPEEAPPDLSSLTASEQAIWQMREIVRLHRRSSKRNDARSLVLLCQRLSAIRGELEEARKREGVGAAPLEPTPAMVALDLVGRDKQIKELAALVAALEGGK